MGDCTVHDDLLHPLTPRRFKQVLNRGYESYFAVHTIILFPGAF